MSGGGLPVGSSPGAAAAPAFRERLRATFRGELRFDEPMARHTTLRVGGPVDVWAAPADVADLQALRAFAAAEGVPTRPLGAGSNLLVRDAGIRGVAITVEALRGVARGTSGPSGLPADANTVWVEAGTSTGKLLKETTGWELGGVEFLGGVPGSVGGGLMMNAGTYLGEFKDVTRVVRAVDPTGRIVVRDHAACGFVYRGSAIDPADIIVDAILDLKPRPRVEMEADVRSLRQRRKEREPKGVPNAGSFFKNPVGDFAGRLIEGTGLKGRTVGGAQVSPVHANWLVNVSPGVATAADFLALVEIVRGEVEARFGVRLEMEVRVIGDIVDEGA